MQTMTSPFADSIGARATRQTTLAWSAAVLALIAGAAIGRAQVQPGDMNAGLQQLQNQPAGGAGAQNVAMPGMNQPGTVPEPGFQAPAQLNRDPFNTPGGQGLPGGEAGLRDPMQPAKELNPNAVKVDENNVVDIHINDEDLRAVLEMLSIQSQRNIIVHKNVANTRLSANLYGVTFNEALDALLHANGFGYVDKGNFIYVYTAADLQKIIEADRKRVSRVVRLNYLNAVDAASFVAPLLSQGSTIKTNGKTEAFPGKSEVPIGSDQFAAESTLVIFDFPENVDAIEQLLHDLDTRPAQILVEATILQTALTEANAFGVDFALIHNMNFNDFIGIGGPLKTVDGLIAGNSTNLGTPSPADIPAPPGAGQGGALVSSPGNTAGPGTFKIGFTDNDTAVFVKLLDEVSDTTILSTPRVLALNRQPARVLIGERVGYLNSTATDGVVSQTVEFLDTGTQLYFRPFVSTDGVIRMELKPQVSSAQIREVRNSQGALVTVPDEITNELTTNVMVRDGQTIVLGGLFRESTESTRRQVPLLGDIPILGTAFRGQEDDVKRSEIIFLITPSIINDRILAAQGEEAEETIRKTRAGAREGTMFFNRDRMASQQLIEAEEAARGGNTDKALYHVNRALALNPHLTDAITMRERLTSRRETWPSHSNLERILRSEADSRVQTLPPATTDGAATSGTGNSATENPVGATTTTATPSESTQQTSAAEAAAMAAEANTIGSATAASAEPATTGNAATSTSTTEPTAAASDAIPSAASQQSAEQPQAVQLAVQNGDEQALVDMLLNYDAMGMQQTQPENVAVENAEMAQAPWAAATAEQQQRATNFVSFFNGAYDFLTLGGFTPNQPAPATFSAVEEPSRD